ncbi:MAG: thermonuclease family protein [Lachnospiraceae bacterium]|nr:thermonuclease family protein [Lachnospiraceae bacterium]
MKEHKTTNENQEFEAEIRQMRELQGKIKSFRKGGAKNPDTGRIPKKSKKMPVAAGMLIVIVLCLFLWIRYRIPTGLYSANPQLEAVELVRVVDGDTIIVKYKDEEVRVRLLTVNCQESVHPDAERNNAEGEAASAFTKEYLADYPILYLQFDEALYDRYDRLLAYVWLEDEVSLDSKKDVEQYMFNAILLEEGYAETVVYEPNHRYAQWFYEIEEQAAKNQK